MAKIWENRASLSNHNISQNLHRYFTLYGTSCWQVSCFWSYSFKLYNYAINQQFWKNLKVKKFMDQHNFEMIHFKCTIPAIGCTVLCRFMVWLWNLKFMLQNEGLDEKKKQYATCALDCTSPKEGEGGRLAGGICVGCEPICHFFKSI